MITPEYSRDRYWTLVGLGLCVKCGKVEPDDGRRECESCRIKHRNHQRNRRVTLALQQSKPTLNP